METDNRQQQRGHRDGTGTPRDVVFLFDVDNTLLDNDAVLGDYRAHLVRESGREAADHYWAIFEELQRELGYVDYLGALQRYRLEHLHDTRVFLLLRSGIRRAVEDRVLIRIHKEWELECVERLYPAAQYVLVDDKLPILAAVKRIWGPRVTTVFPRQGHYALDPDVLSGSPPPDLAVTRISDLLDYDLPALLGAAPGVNASRRREASTRPNDSQQEPWTGGRVTGVDP